MCGIAGILHRGTRPDAPARAKRMAELAVEADIRAHWLDIERQYRHLADSIERVEGHHERPKR